jgi:hypothetical protein
MTIGIATLYPENRREFLDNILNCNDYYVKLFSNNLIESSPTFTECNFDGYTQKKLDKTKWNSAVIESGNVVSSYKDPIIWSCDDSETKTINGYFIVNDEGNVIWYYKFPSTVHITMLQAISLTIKIVLGC